ncbi:hypothetical protein Pla108_00410 [Botrimarina colliarenosi]|uniref:Lipoprotein SmpA/OmlA domain-containing protein n=1 Tax=Botrimarina colliarenosi TaxID=2528001 RepID=A0A5C6AIP1_9BACT|nr:outer membrane protein assembly factor BamE [Botrimarina colliarenosi]TWT99108.1 hypothetical protein Pla108_00410 [Botrimarina colliarenosi]
MLIVSAVCLFLGLGGFLGRQAMGPVVPYRLLCQISEGMSPAEVRARLGSPGEIYPAAQSRLGESWNYYRFLNAGFVTVQFDLDGRVIWVNDESAFSGFP